LHLGTDKLDARLQAAISKRLSDRSAQATVDVALQQRLPVQKSQAIQPATGTSRQPQRMARISPGNGPSSPAASNAPAVKKGP
jgi:hypothetical protein